jgi:dihydrofolate synthase/folylpolyglutamate synthase
MFDLPKFGAGIGLARMASLLDQLSIDRDRLRTRSIVVTGSNGKGSTAAFAAAIGRAAGLKTGLFTSPHLYRINERFKIDGEDIADGELTTLAARVMAAIAHSPHKGYGAFEAQFALACLHFQEARCDLMVFEAGIGGRFDPVRLIGARIVGVTSVDYEHVDLLGSTLEAIVSDKSDACAAGGTIVYGENILPLRAHLAEYNRAREVTSLHVGVDIAITMRGDQQFDLQSGSDKWASLTIALPGRFQINNAAIAAALVRLWASFEIPDLDDTSLENAIREGLAAARWPGRLETIADDPLTVIDVGHTPDGVAQARDGLFATHGSNWWLLVLGTSRDKDIASIAATLAPSFATIICTRAQHKGAAAEDVAAAARAANSKAAIHIAPDIAAAVALSRSLARDTDARIYVAGGLFVAIEYAHAARGGNAADLSFF